ncbi:MAG: bifunctional methylenetetrahydrofolate dehydrogenase/methenyltetrahydrofolate cyclohydrolase FolD [Ignavibacteria bacterium]|nr:bifunctional methylenetetrahydrofolate dehydrogenase/methenyltetrahydrofolate cyclohydrolase FolD [Ignavibacteria bacterium]
MAVLIDGNALAAEIRAEVQAEVAQLRSEMGIVPGLNLLLVGEDPASAVYVRNKGKDCEKVGITSTIMRLPAGASEQEVLDVVQAWNADPAVHGILVQLPLPKHIDEHRVINAISPLKDVDGFHPQSAGKVMIGLDGFIPCTPFGVLEMLRRYNIETSGKHAVVVGRSNIVGKPLSILLAQKRKPGNTTVTICHTGTPNIAEYTRMADILISAVGSHGVITKDHVKPGAVVIDVGINRITLPDGTHKLVGDVLFDEVEPLAQAITPVPGGVGPMTRAMLLRNTLKAALIAGGKQ